MVGINGARILVGISLFAMGLVSPLAGTASAAVINCQADDVSLEGVSATICQSDDAGTPNGDAAELAAIVTIFDSGWTLVGKSDEGGSGVTIVAGVDGTFAIDVSLLTDTDEIAILFKTGGGRNDPDWAGFGTWIVGDLDASQVLTDLFYDGVYDLSSWLGDGASTVNALSHISVFKRRGESVPEPGPLGLLGLGLMALYLGTRKRINRHSPS